MTAFEGDPGPTDRPAAAAGRISFAETRGFSRGYDEAEVDAYVSRAAQDLADRDAELDAVRQEVEHLRGRLMSGDNERVMQSLNILTRAQKTADETVGRADEHSARVMTEARTLHDEARRQAARIIDESHRQAQEVAEQAVADHGELARQTAYLQTMREVARTQMEAFLMGLYDRVAQEYGRADPRAVAEASPPARADGATTARPSAGSLVSDGVVGLGAGAADSSATAGARSRGEARPRPAAVSRPTGA